MEGGVSWATQLYTSLVSYFEKRNPVDIHNYDPAAVDLPLLHELFEQHARGSLASDPDGLASALGVGMSADDEFVDEWSAAGITDASQIRDRFAERFYFGCEADDPMVAMAFDTELQPFSARLHAMFSSDLSHWDVPDMRLVLGEAHEAVDRHQLDDADFEDFVFTNARDFYARANPAFFADTSIADDVASDPPDKLADNVPQDVPDNMNMPMNMKVET
jgi:hypothetical protein